MVIDIPKKGIAAQQWSWVNYSFGALFGTPKVVNLFNNTVWYLCATALSALTAQCVKGCRFGTTEELRKAVLAWATSCNDKQKASSGTSPSTTPEQNSNPYYYSAIRFVNFRCLNKLRIVVVFCDDCVFTFVLTWNLRSNGPQTASSKNHATTIVVAAMRSLKPSEIVGNLTTQISHNCFTLRDLRKCLLRCRTISPN